MRKGISLLFPKNLYNIINKQIFEIKEGRKKMEPYEPTCQDYQRTVFKTLEALLVNPNDPENFSGKFVAVDSFRHIYYCWGDECGALWFALNSGLTELEHPRIMELITKWTHDPMAGFSFSGVAPEHVLDENTFSQLSEKTCVEACQTVADLCSALRDDPEFTIENRDETMICLMHIMYCPEEECEAFLNGLRDLELDDYNAPIKEIFFEYWKDGQ